MARKAGLLKQAGELIGDFKQGFRDDYGIGQEDMRAAGYRKRELQGKQKEAPKMVGMAEAHAGLNRAREIAGQISPEGQQALNEAGLNFRTDLSPAYRAGQIAGTVAGDITQDATRRFYWLLNAAQATGEVINELALATANPALYGRHTLKDKAGNLYGYNTTAAVRDGIVVPKGVDEAGNSIYEPARGIQWDKEQGAYTKRNFEPGHVQSLAIPTGIAVNSAMGLLTPFGGAEGYKAVFPDDEDPKYVPWQEKTSQLYTVVPKEKSPEWNKFMRYLTDCFRGDGPDKYFWLTKLLSLERVKPPEELYKDLLTMHERFFDYTNDERERFPVIPIKPCSPEHNAYEQLKEKCDMIIEKSKGASQEAHQYLSEL